MKCRKCGTENIAGARFCRHCGESLANVENVMDIYPKLKFVPTNFMDWKKPNVGRFIKVLLSIPICILISLSLYCIWSSIFYNQYGYNHDYTPYGYTTKTEDPLDMFIYGWGTCYNFDGDYYSSYDFEHADDNSLVYTQAGEYVSDPLEWTAKESLYNYKKKIGILFLNFVGGSLVLFLIMHFIICGYPKRPKDTKPLHEVADYCQKYSYWGIFRRRKTPKYVFFVKDNLFGILDVAHYSVFLPARYDFLSWREKNKYLNVVINGRNCIIDIYGKELK